MLTWVPSAVPKGWRDDPVQLTVVLYNAVGVGVDRDDVRRAWKQALAGRRQLSAAQWYNHRADVVGKQELEEILSSMLLLSISPTNNGCHRSC